MTAEPAARGREWSRFRRFWLAASISILGDQITIFAVPTIAIIAFHATALQTGIISGLGLLTYPVAGLFVGAITDRLPIRATIVAASLARTALLGTLGVLTISGVLRLWLLGVIVVLSALFGIAADVSLQSLLPQITTETQLGPANSRLESSQAIAQISGPGVGGLLIQTLGPAYALFADAISFLPLITALMPHRNESNADRSPRPVSLQAILADIRDALHFMGRDRILWRLPAAAAFSNLGVQLFRIAFLVFAYRILALQPQQTGLVLTFAGIGAVAGSLMTTTLVNRLGERRTMVIALLGEATALVPVAWLSSQDSVPLACGCFLVSGFVGVPWNAVSRTVRIRRTPPEYQGRVNATARTVALTGAALGAMGGGACVTVFSMLIGLASGSRAALLAGVLVAALGLPLLKRGAWESLKHTPPSRADG